MIIDIELPFYGYNGEEYNPVTGLVYLRYRYYSPELGAFIAEDDYLGDDENVNSQNRYSYCEGDPINFHDPTGHAKSLREREMEYGLDKTTQNFQNYANGQSYGTNIISQGTANAYIQRGTANAHAKNAAYSCESGAKTEAAIAGMTNSINSAKDSANKKIQENIRREEERRKALILALMMGSALEMLGVWGLEAEEVLESSNDSMRIKYFPSLTIGKWSANNVVIFVISNEFVVIQTDNRIYEIDVGENSQYELNHLAYKDQRMNEWQKFIYVRYGELMIFTTIGDYREHTKKAVVDTGLVGAESAEYYALWKIIAYEKIETGREILSNITAGATLALGVYAELSSIQSQNGGKDVAFGSDTKSATKLSDQMKSRGWTKDSVVNTIDNPYTVRPSVNRATGNIATAYYTKKGSYVIVDNVTKAIVQVSDNITPLTWIPDKSIVNPYFP